MLFRSISLSDEEGGWRKKRVYHFSDSWIGSPWFEQHQVGVISFDDSCSCSPCGSDDPTDASVDLCLIAIHFTYQGINEKDEEGYDGKGVEKTISSHGKNGNF